MRLYKRVFLNNQQYKYDISDNEYFLYHKSESFIHLRDDSAQYQTIILKLEQKMTKKATLPMLTIYEKLEKVNIANFVCSFKTQLSVIRDQF